MRRIKKFNNGMGAILCNRCRTIVKEGFYPNGGITEEEWKSEEPLFCTNCSEANKLREIWVEHKGNCLQCARAVWTGGKRQIIAKACCEEGCSLYVKWVESFDADCFREQ